ncbi:hypothetical protein [Bacillus marinisedimentorum]|uniref:hypothetical protein n=1 Tax=Bacillus marinisedimentorum TaxID=1821260 RepID=UPI0007E1BF22|nr:hypothetical protein [Bacillus marinisedimentorum]
MDHRNALLSQLEDDYVQAVKGNESVTVEDFIEQFLYDSWEYNVRNMDKLKRVLTRYESGDIDQGSFTKSFKKMVGHLQVKLAELDQDKAYPVLHSNHGASLLVAFVDGLIVQHYAGVYDADQLRDMTPYLQRVILGALKTEV